MKRYKLFPNLFVYKVSDNHYAIFHPLNLKVIYITEEIYPLMEISSQKFTFNPISSLISSIKNIDTILNILINNGILVDEEFNYEKEIKENIIRYKPNCISGVFIITRTCNLSCEYCIFKNGLFWDNKDRTSMMSPRIILDSTFFFAKHIAKEKPQVASIIFFGGEPLLNFNAIKIITDMMRNLQKKGYFEDVKLCFSMSTNGTLITEEIAEFVKMSDIQVHISIDGFKKANIQRKDKQRKESFVNVLRGYNLIKKKGIPINILCTVGSHNVGFLPQIAEYFATELKPNSVRFIKMKEPLLADNLYKPPIEDLCENMFKAFEILRSANIFESRIGNYIMSLENKTIRPFDCPASRQLVFNYDGKVGKCACFFPNSKYFYPIPNSDGVFNESKLELWRRLTPFKLKNCFYCPGIGFCGLGCPYENERKKGSLFDYDEEHCYFIKSFLEWYLKDKYKKIMERKNVYEKILI